MRMKARLCTVLVCYGCDFIDCFYGIVSVDGKRSGFSVYASSAHGHDFATVFCDQCRVLPRLRNCGIMVFGIDNCRGPRRILT
jgi:hypothetical protein